MGKHKQTQEDCSKPLKTPKKPADPVRMVKNLNKEPPENSPWSESEGEEEQNPSMAELKDYIKALPTAANLKSLFKEFSLTVKEELADIKTEVKQIAHHIDKLEETNNQIISHAEYLETTISNQQKDLYQLKLHLDDLENRSRRNNLRLKGIPESVPDKEIPLLLTQIFNELLGLPEDNDVGLQRAHRVYRPRSSENDRPRDVLCCLLCFRTKEEILAKSRIAKKIEHDGSEISIFQDISRFTLYLRNLLQPFTRTLRDRNIKYRWLFPFGLLLTYQNKSFSIKTPGDMREISRKLDISCEDIPDWTTMDGKTSSPPALPEVVRWTQKTPSSSRRQRACSTSPPPRPQKFGKTSKEG